MAIITPVSKDKAPDDVKPVFDTLSKNFGRVPAIFGTMAHRPGALKHFPALYGAIMNEGTVEPKLKEFAYLKTSIVNGCEY
jgi:alkylhydroperoxidase family enzyme